MSLKRKICGLFLVSCIFCFIETTEAALFLLDSTTTGPLPGNSSDASSVSLPQTTAVNQEGLNPVVWDAHLTADQTNILNTLKPFVDVYLGQINRPDLDSAKITNNFGQLVIGWGGENQKYQQYKLSDMQSILGDIQTLSGVEEAVASFLGKTGKQVDLNSLSDVAALVNFTSLVVNKKYTTDNLTAILNAPDTKDISSALAAFLGKDSLDLNAKSDVAILVNFASLVAIDKKYAGNDLIAILRGLGPILAKTLNRTPNYFSAKANIESFVNLCLVAEALSHPLAVFLGKNSIDLNVKADVDILVNFTSLVVNKKYTTDNLTAILNAPDTKDISSALAAFLGKEVLDLTVNNITQLTGLAKLAVIDSAYAVDQILGVLRVPGLNKLYSVEVLLGLLNKISTVNNIDQNLFIQLLPLAKWSDAGIDYISELLENETTRSIVENWAVVAPKAKELIWRDLILDYFNIKDEGILGGIILAAQERTGKAELTSADVLSTIEALRTEFDNQAGSDYFSDLTPDEIKVKELLEGTEDTEDKEGALGRKLDPKSYKDKLALDYWVKIARVKGIEFVTTNFAERKALMDTPQERAGLISNIAQRVGGDIAQQLSLTNKGSWDWSWLELAQGGTADRIVESVVGGSFMKKFLENSIWSNIIGSQRIVSSLNLNSSVDRSFWAYFTEYLPYSGASERQVVKFILAKMKFLPYDAVALDSPLNGAGAISSAGKTSFDVFAEGNPFSAEEEKRMLLLSPTLKYIIGELFGRPVSLLPVGESGNDFLNGSLDQLIAYFVNMRDISTGIMADAMGGTDNSMGTAGFLAMAALMGAEKGDLSPEKANQIVSAIVDFISQAQGQFGLLYHYYRPQTDERAGNSEVSLIDTYLTVAALTAYRNWDQSDPATVTKINNFINSIRLDKLLQKVDMNNPALGLVESGLNFGWTPERGLTAGDVNFNNEYILVYLIGIGSAQENNSDLVATLVDKFNTAITRKMGSGASGEEFIYTWENSMFQYQYPLLFIPLMFLSRTETLEDKSTFDLNNFQNAIVAMYNQQATAVQQSGNFRSYGYYPWSIAPSAARSNGYIMTLSVPPAGSPLSYDGTISANAIAGAMQLAPILSYDGLRYMALAFPQMQGEYGFKDSVNPERNWVAPTYFSLGQGLQLMGTWNALFYGNDDGIDTPLELNMKDKHILASLFNGGFSLDEQFKIGDYSGASTDIKDGLAGLETQFNALKNGEAVDEKTLTSAFESAFKTVLDKSDNNADFNYILNWFESKETGKFSYTADGKLNPEISSDKINTNFTLFPLFMKTVAERAKAGLGDILEEPDVNGKTGIELAWAYIDKVEEIRQAASRSDETAIFAFQHFLEVSDKYYAEAIKALNPLIQGTIDTPEEVQAQALLFIAYKKTWQYDEQKQAFIELAKAVKDNEDFKKTAVDLIAKYFGKEILADYNGIWVAPETELFWVASKTELNDEQKKQKGYIQKSIETALDFADPENPPDGKSLNDVLVGNKISLISLRENYFNQNVSLNPLDSNEAGEIGFYVTQLFLNKDTTEEDVVGLITDMAMLKPLVEASLGRPLDLQNSKEDVALLSLAVSSGSKINPNIKGLSDVQFLEIAKTVSGRDGLSLADISTAIESVRGFELSQGAQDKIKESEFLRQYLDIAGKSELKDTVQSIFTEYGLQPDEQMTDEWTQLIADLLTKDNVDEALIARVVTELPKIELKTGASTILQDKNGFYVYKDEYFGNNSNLDLQDESVIQVVKIALEVEKALSGIFVGITGDNNFDPENSALDRLLVARLTKVVLDTGVAVSDLPLADIKKTLDGRTQDDSRLKALFASIVPHIITDNLRADKSATEVITDGIEEEIKKLDLSSIPVNDMVELSGWIEKKDKERLLAIFKEHLATVKAELPGFLEEYVLGEKFDSGNSGHVSKFNEWFGLRIPELEESMHKLYDISADKDLVYRLGMAVDVEQFILTTPETQDVLDRTNLEPAVNWLYGGLLDNIKPTDNKDAVLSQNNVVYRALLAFFAEQPESEVVTSLFLSSERELLKGGNGLAGLEGLYGVSFDILRNSEHIGIAGFYMDEVKNKAGIGVTDLFTARLLKQGKTSAEVASEIGSLADVLQEALKTDNASLIEYKFKGLFAEGFNLTDAEIKQEAENWLEYLKALKDESSKNYPEFSGDELIKVAVDPVILIMKESLDMAVNIIALLVKKDNASLAKIFAEGFGLNSSGEGQDLANHIAGVWIKKLESELRLGDYQDAVQIASLQVSKGEVAKIIDTMSKLGPYVDQYLIAKDKVFGTGKNKLNLFSIEDIGILSFYAQEVLKEKKTLEEQIRFLETAAKLLEYAAGSTPLKGILSLDFGSVEYKINLELFKINKGITGELSEAQLKTFKETFIDGRISYWTEKIINDAKDGIPLDKQITGLIELLSWSNKLSPILEKAGLLSINPEDASYKAGLEEFFIEKAQELGMTPEELKADTKLSTSLTQCYDFYYQDGIKMSWASQALELKTGEGKEDEEVLDFYAKFFPAIETVERILTSNEDFSSELKLGDSGYLESQARTGILSFWAEKMIDDNLTEAQLIEIFTLRKEAAILVSNFLDLPINSLSDPNVSGVVSLVAKGLKENPAFDITLALDKEFLTKLLFGTEEERNIIKGLRRNIACSKDFSDFLAVTQISGDDISINAKISELTENQQGFLMALTNLAWRLKTDKGDEAGVAVSKVGQRLRDIKDFIITAGITPEKYAEYVKAVIADSRQMGRWSYYLDLTQPLNTETRDLEKSINSKNLITFFERYQKATPGIDPRTGQQIADPQRLLLQFGPKLDWSLDEWATFKVLLERYVGPLLASKEWVKLTNDSGAYTSRGYINDFFNNYLNSSVLTDSGTEYGFIRKANFDLITLQKWATVVNTFGRGDTIEAKWQDFIVQVVAMRKQIETLMPDYFGKYVPYDPFDSVHQGVVAAFLEQAFFKIFMTQDKANKAGADWIVNGKEIDPYERPQEFLNEALAEVIADIKTATELKPLIEAARMAILDVSDPTMAGIIWFHVNTLKDHDPEWVQFDSKEALIAHLKKEALVMHRLADIGRYLNILDSGDMGALSYAAENDPWFREFSLLKWTDSAIFGDKLTPENAIASMVYLPFSKLLYGETDNNLVRLQEAGPILEKFLDSNPCWEGWKDSLVDGMGFNYSLMTRIKSEIDIAVFIQDAVSRFLGVEKLDLTNTEHIRVLGEWAHKLYLETKIELGNQVAAGKIVDIDQHSGWAVTLDAAGNFDSNVSSVMQKALDKYGLNDLAAPIWGLPGGEDNSPYRYWLMEIAETIVAPRIAEELDILAKVRPLAEKIEGRKLDLSIELDRKLLDNYKAIAVEAGKEIVLDKYRGDIAGLGRQFILKKYDYLVKGKGASFVLGLYADEIELAGEQEVFKAHWTEVINSGLAELTGRISGESIPVTQVAVLPAAPAVTQQAPSGQATSTSVVRVETTTVSVPSPTVEQPTTTQEPVSPVSVPVVQAQTATEAGNTGDLLAASWGLSGDSLTATAAYFENSTWRHKLESIFREYFVFGAQASPFIEKTIARLITGIAGLTQGKFNFWLEKDSSVSYPRYITQYQGADGAYRDFLARFFDYFFYELEDALASSMPEDAELRRGLRDYRNLESSFDNILNKAFEQTVSKHGLYTNGGIGKSSHYVKFSDAIKDIISSLTATVSISLSAPQQAALQTTLTAISPPANRLAQEDSDVTATAVVMPKPVSVTVASVANTDRTVKAKAVPGTVAVSSEKTSTVSVTSFNKAPEYSSGITTTENIAKLVTYYRRTNADKATVAYWENWAFNPLKNILRNAPQAFAATDMLMDSLKTQFGTLPYMTNKGKGIWYDWVNSTIRNMRNSYSHSRPWQESMKEAIEKTGETLSGKVELYFDW